MVAFQENSVIAPLAAASSSAWRSMNTALTPDGADKVPSATVAEVAVFQTSNVAFAPGPTELGIPA
jgi:hypothetical protein